MATNKLGTLVYDLVVDTKNFQKGLVRSSRELTAMKKLFLETRTPIERLGIQFDGMRKLIKEGAQPLDMFSRSIADLSVATKGGGREARKFAQSLREEAREIVKSSSSQKSFNAEKLTAVNNLFKAADAIEHEVNAVRNSKAEHLRASKAKKDSAKETAKLTTATNSANKALGTFGSGMARQAGALVRQISAISALYTAIRQVRAGISDALEIGRSQRQFETFTGSAEVAAGLMNDLRQFAAETPVTLQAGQQATRTLLQYGVEQSDVIEVVRQLGDVSGGSTEALQRLSLAFGQITANTRLQGQELRQLIEAGFNPLAQISERTGESMFDLRQRMADGTLSAQEVAQAFEDATSGSGRFANALENISTETAFGRIERLRGELVRLRAEFGMSFAEGMGDIAADITANISAFREDVRQQLLLGITPTPDQLRPSMPRGGAADLFGLGTMLERLVKVPAMKAMIDAQKEALELAQKQVSAELPKFLEAIYRPQDENRDRVQKVTDAIHERIAALREEREVLLLGADEAELQEFRRQGASTSYIESLRQEMKILQDAKDEQESREKAEKEAHDAKMKRLRERQQAEKKAIEERRSQIEADRQKAQALIDSVMTPLERLEKQMTEIQRVSKFLTPLQRTRLMDKALDAFNAGEVGDEALQATAVTRGSVEEFRLIAQINSTQIDQQQRHHNEAQGQRKAINEKLDRQIRGLNLLPMKFGEELSDFMPTAVGSSPLSGGNSSFFGPSRGPEAYN